MKIIPILQVIIAAGLLNVWLLRSSKQTLYRGGASKNLKEEFAAYGLAPWFYYLIGTLKIISAFGLIFGLWNSSAALIASSTVSILMIGALAMHLKVKDPIKKLVPALLMLGMSLFVAYAQAKNYF